ncbi:MAG: nucleoside-triphosphatase [Faecousia sp.]
MRRLFLTGPIGCGKSTAIEAALGNWLPLCGGFRTRRGQMRDGHPENFVLESPDGRGRQVFLDFSRGAPEVYMEVFAGFGTSMLRGDVLILDEIGGVELLCPEFVTALETVLHSDVPILGVMKGEGPAGALVETLGLTERYTAAADRLRRWMEADTDTCLYRCGQFDETAALLARKWVEEYVHG